MSSSTRRSNIPLNIRSLQRGDTTEWSRLRLVLWPDQTVLENQAEMKSIFHDPDCQVFVAVRQEGNLVGFLEASLRKYADGCETSPVGYIEGWFVEADVRLSGVGRQLVEAAEAWARQRGCTEIASDCELDNLVSFQAHLACGYEETGRIIQFRKSLL